MALHCQRRERPHLAERSRKPPWKRRLLNLDHIYGCHTGMRAKGILENKMIGVKGENWDSQRQCE